MHKYIAIISNCMQLAVLTSMYIYRSIMTATMDIADKLSSNVGESRNDIVSLSHETNQGNSSCSTNYGAWACHFSKAK